MITTEFKTIMLPLKKNMFEKLSNSVEFEKVGKGRESNILLNVTNEGIPLVRTTTKYTIPTQNFSLVHHKLIEEIKRAVKSSEHLDASTLNFNNALIDIYDENYRKMKYHSDQCLDVKPNSFIGIYSCYEEPNNVTEHSLRKLKIQNKTTKEEFEIALTHNSFILFSVETNSKFLHKITLEQVPNKKNKHAPNRWMGLTFRESKTFITFKEELPYFPDGTVLKLGNESEENEFYKLRGQENRSQDFLYPFLDYTLSLSDRMMPLVLTDS